MSYLRITNPGLSDVVLADLGYTVATGTSNFVISNQFGVEDLQNSADLKAAVNAGDLTAQVNLDGNWTSVAAADFDGEDVYAAFANIYEIVNTVDNQRLVNGTDCSTSTQLHHHDARYFTETELGASTAPSGASLIGFDDTGLLFIDATNVQDAISDLNAAIVGFDLDDVYTNDTDGIMNVDDLSKPLELRSDDLNDILISRAKNFGYGLEQQNFLLADVSTSELVLGYAATANLPQIDVHILTNLVVDGNVTFTGTITDTTVNELNVTNANIIMRTGAVTDASATLEVYRPVAGTNASLKWDEGVDRWKAGLFGSEQTIALLEANESVTGVWTFTGSATTDPNMLLTNKTAAATTNLGGAGVAGLELINYQLCTYDKSNSRNAFLTVARYQASFSGRDSGTNRNEYLRTDGSFTSNETGWRVMQDCMIVGITLESSGAVAWTARVRKNYLAADIATKATGGARGVQDNTLAVSLSAGDTIQVYLDSGANNVKRPHVVVEYAYKY